MEQELPNLLHKIGVWKQTDIDHSIEKYLKNIREEGPEFTNASLDIMFIYNYGDLLKFSKQLLALITLDVYYYEHILRQVVLIAVNSSMKTTAHSSIDVKIDQIHLIQRFEGLPIEEEYQFYPAVKNTLSNLIGVVTGRSAVKSHIRRRVWYCESKCPSGDKRPQSGFKIPKCTECLKNMKEFVKLRDVCEYVMLKVFTLDTLQTPRSIRMTKNAFEVHLTDDLALFKVVLGSAYKITGLYDITKGIFAAWNISELEDI